MVNIFVRANVHGKVQNFAWRGLKIWLSENNQDTEVLTWSNRYKQFYFARVLSQEYKI